MILRATYCHAARKDARDERAAHQHRYLLERSIAILSGEERGCGGLFDSEHVEVDQIVDVDVRVAVEAFTDVDARAHLFGECSELLGGQMTKARMSLSMPAWGT